MVEKMKKEDMLEKIDFNNIPNYKYIGEDFKNLSYDPNNEYSVPYFWGSVGIVYDKTKVSEKDLKEQGFNIFLNQNFPYWQLLQTVLTFPLLL